MMEHKFVWILFLTFVTTSTLISEARDRFADPIPSAEVDARGPVGPRVSIKNLANSTGQINPSNSEGLWVLMPNNLTESQLTGAEFDLYKLNTDQLFSSLNEQGPQITLSKNQGHELIDLSGEKSGSTSEGRTLGRRESRKMKFFPNFMKKPRVSPLYLVNGTVCRFVNSQPICTTLSTTGLFGEYG